MNLRQVKVRLFLCTAGAVLLLFAAGGCDRSKTGSPQESQAQTVSDRPLTSAQDKLLDIAFQTASAIPPKPHLKDRSKAQEQVVVACLELGQSVRAHRYTERIENWRKGYCYALLAFDRARSGFSHSAQPLLEKAEKIAAEENSQDWRRDRIRSKIAQVYTLLGQPRKADAMEVGLVESERGRTAAADAMIAEDSAFDEQVKALDAVLGSGSFDTGKAAMEAYAQLYSRYYSQPSRRDLIEEKIKAAWVKIPVVVRLDLLAVLTDSAIGNADRQKALELADQWQTFIDENQWPAEARIALTSELIKRRFRAGDCRQAKIAADTLRAFYESEKQSIITIYRAGALRPLAEAFEVMGNTSAALDVYRMAVEAGVENPNSRPRAEDLSATCCSMAVRAVEPDAQLWTRIQHIYDRLGQPW